MKPTNRMYIYSDKQKYCGHIEYKSNQCGSHARELVLSIRSGNQNNMIKLRNLEFEIIDSLKAKGFTVEKPQLHLRKL